MTDIVADRLEREAGINKPLHAGVPERVRAGATHRHTGLVKIMAGAA